MTVAKFCLHTLGPPYKKQPNLFLSLRDKIARCLLYPNSLQVGPSVLIWVSVFIAKRFVFYFTPDTFNNHSWQKKSYEHILIVQCLYLCCSIQEILGFSCVKFNFYRLINHARSFPKDKRKIPLVDIGWSLAIAQWHIYFSMKKII